MYDSGRMNELVEYLIGFISWTFESSPMKNKISHG